MSGEQIVDRVREVLATADLRTVCRRDIAKSLEISTSSLDRRLVEAGTSFLDLRDEERIARIHKARCKLAKQVLEEVGLSTKESFYRWHRERLGYSWRASPLRLANKPSSHLQSTATTTNPRG